jgi:tetratricopeptide (TPR) repeat protein
VTSDKERALREAADRGDTEASLDLAALLEDQGDVDGAIEEYRKLDAKGVLNGTGNLARLLKERGAVAEAEEAFKRCADAGSERAEALYVALRVRRGAATHEEVIKLVAVWAQHMDNLQPGQLPPQDQWTTAQYDAFVMMSDLDDLWPNNSGNFPILESICDRDAVIAGLHAADAKGSPAAAHELGAYFQGRGDLLDASRAFERSAEHGWKSALYEAGVMRYQAQDIHGALDLAKRAAEQKVFGGLFLVGVIQRQLKNNEEAMSAWIDADLAGDARASFELGKLMAWLAEQAGSNDAGAARPYLEKAAAAGISEAQELLDRFR